MKLVKYTLYRNPYAFYDLPPPIIRNRSGWIVGGTGCCGGPFILAAGGGPCEGGGPLKLPPGGGWLLGAKGGILPPGGPPAGGKGGKAIGQGINWFYSFIDRETQKPTRKVSRRTHARRWHTVAVRWEWWSTGGQLGRKTCWAWKESRQALTWNFPNYRSEKTYVRRSQAEASVVQTPSEGLQTEEAGHPDAEVQIRILLEEAHHFHMLMWFDQ